MAHVGIRAWVADRHHWFQLQMWDEYDRYVIALRQAGLRPGPLQRCLLAPLLLAFAGGSTATVVVLAVLADVSRKRTARWAVGALLATAITGTVALWLLGGADLASSWQRPSSGPEQRLVGNVAPSMIRLRVAAPDSDEANRGKAAGAVPEGVYPVELEPGPPGLPRATFVATDPPGPDEPVLAPVWRPPAPALQALRDLVGADPSDAGSEPRSEPQPEEGTRP